MWNQNRQFRIYTIAMLTVMAVVLALFNIGMNRILYKMQNGYYNVIAELLQNTVDRDSEFSEEEWIKILNKSNVTEDGDRVLVRYGIFPGDMPSLNQKKYRTEIFVVGNMLIVLLCVGIFALFVNYQKNRDRKVNELTSYIRQIERGIYALEMEDNMEDELSGLKNELYKITIMLKETARYQTESKKALADSVSDISHQLKTPLTSCLVLLDNLSESPNMDETTQHRFLAEITRQITNINWLIVTLLKLSRMDAGVVEFARDEISVDDMINEIFEDLAIMAELKQIQLKKEGRSGAVIHGDAHWIKEAVTNLIKNAIEHSPEYNGVYARIEDNAVYTAISVVDYGEGIPVCEQKHIFERFYRSSTAKEDSIGIGLALSKEIVERQNGYITVYSEQGKYTEFLIKFLKS